MNLRDALKQQDILHAEAHDVIEQLNLKAKFSTIGDLIEKGSFSYKLMVVPDIDFNIYVEDPLIYIPKISPVVSSFLENKLVEKVSVVKSGYVRPPAEGKPQGIWIGIQAVFNNRMWNTDIWILSRSQHDDTPLGVDMHSITEEQRNLILELKATLHEQGRYGHKNEFYSADIYKAVCLHGAVSIEDLERIKNK